jgi:hypothetical protein
MGSAGHCGRFCLVYAGAGGATLTGGPALAGFQAADGRQPPQPVVGDAVALAAQLLGQRDLAQARATSRGVGYDPASGDDEPGVGAAIIIGVITGAG